MRSFDDEILKIEFLYLSLKGSFLFFSEKSYKKS